MDRVRAAMVEREVDVLLLSVGPDLPWLAGYEAMPLERLTMLVVPVDGDPTLVVPRLEAPRVVERPGVFGLRAFGETDDPVRLVAELVGSGASTARLAVGDRTWARFVVDLQAELPGARWSRASTVTGPLRALKEPGEIEALRAAGEAADRVAAQLQCGEIGLVGRTEAEVSADLGARLLAEGHQRVNFAIVASGPNAASPHHEPGDRVIAPGDLVLCDFGGTMFTADGVGYCSDITRCVSVGEPPSEVADAYAILHEAQEAAVEAATLGTACEEVDAVARRIITAAGFGDRFIHRTGHGIGVEEHEDPYIVVGNAAPLEAGNAFSVEPGIYTERRWGLRLEDIVVATPDGPDPLNTVDHALVVVDG
ncbi:MAG: aminopeptidase P family protein [Acidimicrobiales bacterium]|nr:aminopeptidase P family protein [Acidimicrobiales bacterium]